MQRDFGSVLQSLRVASSLDSMVVGEPQILGQMKQAVKTAEAAGSLGLVLNRLFQRTFAVAKEVRTNTAIGSASISMAAASVPPAGRIFPSVPEQRVLLPGAGAADAGGFAATHRQGRARRRRSLQLVAPTRPRFARIRDLGNRPAPA